MPPRYSPNDEPDKLDSDPVEAATATAPDQPAAAVDEPVETERSPE